MDFVFNIMRAAGHILLPMFFRPRTHAGLYGVLHAIVVILVTGGLGYLQWHFGLKKFVGYGPNWLRISWLPVMFALCYLLAWFAWWLWKLFQTDDEAARFSDLDACWAEIMAALSKSGIGLGDTPIYLALGRFRGQDGGFFQTGQPLAINGAPGDGAPVQLYAHREAIYLTCTGASLAGRQANLLEGAAAAGAPSATGSVGINVDKSIGMSEVAGTGSPIGDVQQIIRKARDENRGLTADEHRQIRELTGVSGDTNKQALRSSHQSVLKSAEEADEHTARLRYLCRLLSRAREPLCPLNGVILMVTLNATDTDEDAQQFGLVLQRDLQTIRESARLHCPIFALVGDMQRLQGADDFLAQFPADKRRQRMGKGFPLVPDLPADAVLGAVESSVRWIFDALIPYWVFKLFRVELHNSPVKMVVDGNAQLFFFLNDLRERSARLSRLVARAVVFGLEAPPLFGGCYLAGPDTGSGAPFVPGFLKRLDEAQGFVAWTADAFAADASYSSRTKFGYTLLGLGAIAVAALAVWVFFLRKG